LGKSKMKIEFNIKDFAAAATIVKPVPERRNTAPILASAMLHVESDGDAVLTTTNLDTELNVEFKVAAPEAEIECILPLAILDFFIQRAAIKKQDTTASIEVDGLNVVARHGRARLELPTLPVADFPVMRTDDANCIFTMHGAELAQAMTALRPAISNEETRYYLNGVYFDASADRLCLIATNGHQLNKVEMDVPDGAETMPGIIVPSKTIGLITGLFSDFDEYVTVSVSENTIEFNAGQLDLKSKLIDGRFPDWRRVLPKKSDHSFTAFSDDILNALRTIEATPANNDLAGAKFNKGAKFSAGESLVKLSISGADGASGSDSFDAETSTTPPPEFGAVSRYIKEACNSIGSGKLTFHIIDAGSPIKITREGDDGTRHPIAIVMPMRV